MTPEQEATKQAFVRGCKKWAIWMILAVVVLLLNIFALQSEQPTKMERLWRIVHGIEVAAILPVTAFIGYLSVRIFWFPFPGGKVRMGMEGLAIYLIFLAIGVYLAIFVVRK